MNAMEKVAWTEVIVSTLAMLTAVALYPLFGDAASAAFAILGFVVFGMVFLRRRGKEITTDERDRTIEKRATYIAVQIAWLTTICVLAVLTVFYGTRDADIPRSFVVWLVWTQMALLYFAKGIIALRAYRGNRHAAQV